MTILPEKNQTRSWALFMIGSTAFATAVEAAILPIYFQQVAANPFTIEDASIYWGYLSATALFLAALLAPLLGSIADEIGGRRRLFAISNTVAILATGALILVGPGGWMLAAILYLVAAVAGSCTYLFYISLLPHMAPRDQLDRLACESFGWSYVGGVITLVLALGMVMFVFPDSTWGPRVAFLLMAIWWAVASAILLPRIPEPPAGMKQAGAGTNLLITGVKRVAATFRDIRKNHQLFTFLCALALYTGGVNTIVTMATSLGLEIGIGTNELIGALVLNQAIAIPVMWLVGRTVAKTGAKRILLAGLFLYTLISIAGYFMVNNMVFWMLAGLLGVAQGIVAALGVSMFSKMIPLERSGEFFGAYIVAMRLSGIVGPMSFGLLASLLATTRLAMLLPLVMFFAGRAMLAFVDDDRAAGQPDGQEQAAGSENEPATAAGEAS
jgi:UMF1 family MFS transporter